MNLIMYGVINDAEQSITILCLSTDILQLQSEGGQGHSLQRGGIRLSKGRYSSHRRHGRQELVASEEGRRPHQQSRSQTKDEETIFLSFFYIVLCQAQGFVV